MTMFRSSALLSFIFAALLLESLASPVIRDVPKMNLAFTTRFNGTNIVAADRARAKALKSGSLAGLSTMASISAVNSGVTYTANVGVGNPATNYTLLIDTGSSNTWVGADKKYVRTKTSCKTGLFVDISYGSGSMSGNEFIDQVTLGNGLVINNQSIGAATWTDGFFGVDGILGIGPVELTYGTVSDGSLVPTVTDNLLSQGTISTEVIGIFYAPVGSSPLGELTFGGVDTSHTTSAIQYTPLTSTYPASLYWGIDQYVTYGSDMILCPTAGIVDTGTTLILLATEAFESYQFLTGATLDYTTGLLTITNDQYDNLQPLNFQIGGLTYTLTPNAQIWPRSFNTEIGGNPGQIYLVVADLGTPVGEGLDFINGYTFLERYYSVYDTTHSRIGFATTPFTDSTTN